MNFASRIYGTQPSHVLPTFPRGYRAANCHVDYMAPDIRLVRIGEVHLLAVPEDL
jgi:hypothetical protein